MKTLLFKRKVAKVRTIAKDQLRQIAESLSLSKKSIRYLTTLHMIDWHCDGIIDEQLYSISAFQDLIINLRKIVNSLPALVLEDYYAT